MDIFTVAFIETQKKSNFIKKRASLHTESASLRGCGYISVMKTSRSIWTGGWTQKSGIYDKTLEVDP